MHPTETNTEMSPMTQSLETVSVLIPCYNEELYIRKALDQLVDQFEKSHYEIVIVDGMSIDRTRKVIDAFREEHPDLMLTIVDNPARHIPIALNLGVRAARGEIIARMDAHAVPPAGYVRRCVEVLRQDNVGAVGMPCLVKPGADTLMARAIAGAVSHPFGIGDATYRLSSGTLSQEAVDTVAFACFRKSLWQELGGFNENLRTNEDYDFNYRIRTSGKNVILDRSGQCDYFARTTLSGLAKQYRRYGGWKARMLRGNPGSVRLRHLVAPVFVLSLILLLALGIFWPPVLILLALELGLYLIMATRCAHQIACSFGGDVRLYLVVPLVLLTIHLNWGTSLLVGLFREPKS